MSDGCENETSDSGQVDKSRERENRLCRKYHSSFCLSMNNWRGLNVKRCEAMWVVAGGWLACLSSVPQVVTTVRTARIRAHRSRLWVFSPWISYCAGLAQSPPTHSSPYTNSTVGTQHRGGAQSPVFMWNLRIGWLIWGQIIFLVTFIDWAIIEVSFCISGSGCLDWNLSDWRHLRKTLNGNTDFTHEIQSLPMWGEAFLNFKNEPLSSGLFQLGPGDFTYYNFFLVNNSREVLDR